MDNAAIIANALGLISIIVYIICYYWKSKRQIVSMHLLCNVCDITQYLLLTAYAAMSRSLISLISNLIFLKWKNKYIIISLALFKVILIMLNYENIINVFMAILITLSTWALLYSTEQNMRIISIFDSSVWMIYDYNVGAYMASIGDICAAVFIFIAYIKYRRLESKSI